MIVTTKYLALVVCSMTLAACGGGGSSSVAPADQIGLGTTDALFGLTGPGDSLAPVLTVIPATSGVLAKYEGVWQQTCVDHKRLTTTLKVNATNDNFTVTPLETHYAYKDCTGDVVAIGSYGGPSETVKYSDNLNASITLTDGTTIQADVNPASSTIASATFTLTGSGVKPSINLGGTNYTQIQYADAVLPVLYKERVLTGGATFGGLLLRNENLPNEELLTLIPVTGAPDYSFKVNLQFFR